MRFAVSIPNMGDASAVVDLAVAAEQAGWDGVFLWDHVHFVRELNLDVFDPWVLLGAIAARTSTVRLGALITPVARRRPQKLAKEIVTLDHLSGGRTIVGVGLGEPAQDEFAAFGEDADARVRAERLDEGLAVIDQLVRGEPVRHEGRHLRVDAHLHPAAVQQPRPPIWVAGMWPHRRPFERAGRWDGVVPIAADGSGISPDRLEEVVAACGGARPGFDVVAIDTAGIDPEEFESVGATWQITGSFPVDDWLASLGDAIRRGPPE